MKKVKYVGLISVLLLSFILLATVSCGRRGPTGPEHRWTTSIATPTPTAIDTATFTPMPVQTWDLIPPPSYSRILTGGITPQPYYTPTRCPDYFELGFEEIYPAFSCPSPIPTTPAATPVGTPTPIAIMWPGPNVSYIITSLDEFHECYPGCEPRYRVGGTSEYRIINFDEKVLVYEQVCGSSMCPVWVEEVVVECGEVKVRMCVSHVCYCAFGCMSTYVLVDKVDLPYRFGYCPRSSW